MDGLSTSFVYFSYGKPGLHNRTVLSVLSLVAQHSLQAGDKILVFTDDPAYYSPFFREINVEYVALRQPDVQRMMGDDDLIHRVKIGIIEQAGQLYPHNKLLYIDSDTFFHQPFVNLLNAITPQNTLMHKFEYQMDTLVVYPFGSIDNFREFYEFLLNNDVLLNGEVMKINPAQFASWNAGIIGLHPTHFGWLPLVYQLTDQFYAAARCHACEQYAFSYVLQTYTTLQDCESVNYHYWHKVEKQITDEKLLSLLPALKNSTSENKLETVKQVTRQLLKTYPSHAYRFRYEAMIAFGERQYAKGYTLAFKTLLRNPQQPFVFFKDVGYYTKQLFKA